MLRKYTLYLAGLLGLVLGGAACGDSHPRAGFIDAAWNIDSQTSGGTTCERAGISTVVLSAQDAVHTNVKPDFTYFNCVDRGGLSNPLAPGEYFVALYGYQDPNTIGSVDPIGSYQFPVTYFVDPDSTTQLPEVSLIVP